MSEAELAARGTKLLAEDSFWKSDFLVFEISVYV